MVRNNSFHPFRYLISCNSVPFSEFMNTFPVLLRNTGVVSPQSPRTIATRYSFSGNISRSSRNLTLEMLNPGIKEMQYAIRGPLAARASEIEKELQKGVKKPFTEVIKANVGDSHSMGQIPITFIRQILALVAYQALLHSSRFPNDVKRRAKRILDGCNGGSVGSYSDSTGIEIIRRHVAEYIERRDGIKASWENIVLCAGASMSITAFMRLLITEVNGKKSGVMIPVPQYPLFSAILSEFNMHQIHYYLDEEKYWTLDMAELKRTINEARKVCNPRAIVVINPGNPTGQVLSRKNIEEVIKFAYEEKLLIFADEVYQDNVYAEGIKFYSFRKVLLEMGPPYSEMELASFMSASKGYMGECGLRVGYCEFTNLDPQVKAMYIKSTCIACPSVLGQAAIDCVVKPPEPGDDSYDQYMAEKKTVLDSLAAKANIVAETFNSVNGISCKAIQGAIYAFPQILIPSKAVIAAKEKKLCPDTFYAFELLENTGICVVPGSGFGQKPGTYHFRTTILPQDEKLKRIMDQFKEFHESFLQKYS